MKCKINRKRFGKPNLQKIITNKKQIKKFKLKLLKNPPKMRRVIIKKIKFNQTIKRNNLKDKRTKILKKRIKNRSIKIQVL